ncbi:hypothetical protein HK103_007039 [Boothiomyces macroporosus]|uniref:MATE efflux family protein n=1 Tax=Boothiomyces macroporosus TaxID=261099 RepID=A0AAD5UD27_9FUNG|nr:hypothetical protein HK103_007039 [Boothiomyces macroporosus]
MGENSEENLNIEQEHLETDPLLPQVEDIDNEDDSSLTPRHIFEESKTLGKLAWPVLFSYLVSYSITMAPVFSLGHIGKTYLAASALTTMFCNVTGFSVGLGMSSALDTLCSQSFTGAIDKFSLGKHLQRAIVVEFFLAIPIAILWWFTEPVLLLLGQNPEIARISGLFARFMIPGLFPYLVNSCLQRYLQGQGIMRPSLYILLIASPINIFLQWLLVWSPLKVGPYGAPIATSIVNTLLPLLSMLYIKFVDGGECYGGWEWKEALDLPKIYTVIKLGLPGILMMCSEWWAFEIIALAAGILGDDILAAQTVVLQTCSLCYCVPLGISVATTTRIGNSLGAGKARAAKHIAFTGLAIGLIFAVINSTLLLSFKDVLGYLFTDDVEVVRLVANILPLAALFQLSDSIGATGGGAQINLSGYYIIGLPLGGLLAFKFDYGLLGLWIGITVGLVFVSIIEVIIISWRTDWDTEVEKALKLVRNISSDDITFLLDQEAQ